eukprot:m51a1_g10048 putative udp-n-acetylglucosamine (369) ;mRNA; r:39636-40902
MGSDSLLSAAVFTRARLFLLANRVAAMALVAMVAQNSTYVLLMRYSRGVRHDKYILGTCVFLGELVKMAISATAMLLLRSHKDRGTPVTDMFLNSLRTSLPTAVPALLYFIQNVLQFVGLQNLEAGVFSVLAQLKTLTAAVFGVLMLGKRLSTNQWRALCLLVLAAILIETPSSKRGGSETESNGVGVLAVLAMVTTSGVSGTVTERLLKDARSTIWERNFHLSIYGSAFALVSVLVFDGGRVLDEGFFTGHSLVSMVIVVVGAVGGILVAVVMKYTDNIVKGFATAVAICTTSMLSLPLLGADLGSVFWIGVAMVVLSIFNYADVAPAVGPPSLASTLGKASSPLPMLVIEPTPVPMETGRDQIPPV